MRVHRSRERPESNSRLNIVPEAPYKWFKVLKKKNKQFNVQGCMVDLANYDYEASQDII